MNKEFNILFNIKNSYGISELKKEFKFQEDNRGIVIFAKNGTMKTTFTKTIEYFLSKEKSESDENYVAITNDEKEFKNILIMKQTLEHDKKNIIDVNQFYLSQILKEKINKNKKELNTIIEDSKKIYKNLIQDSSIYNTLEGCDEGLEFSSLLSLLLKINENEIFIDFINNNDFLCKLKNTEIEDLNNYTIFFSEKTRQHIFGLENKDNENDNKHFLEVLERKIEENNFREIIKTQLEFELSKLIILKIYFDSQNILDKFLKNKEEDKKIQKERTEEMNNIDVSILKSYVNEFNNSFNVNFKIKFTDNGFLIDGETPTPGLDLYSKISLGEERALKFMENIIEIEKKAQKNEEDNFLLVIDDIVDSFDFHNTNGVIDFLNRLKNKNNNIYFLFLTHSLDFQKQLNDKFFDGKERHLKAIVKRKGRNNKKIDFEEKKDFYSVYEDVFANLNKYASRSSNKGLKTDDYAELFSSIIFLRGLSEVMRDKNDKNCIYYNSFKELTSFLHYKENTKNLNMGDYFALYKKLKQTENSSIIDFNYLFNLRDTSEKIISEYEDDESSLNIYRKFTLSIYIRLLSEFYMIKKIKENSSLKNYEKNQFVGLLTDFKNVLNKNNKVHNDVLLLERIKNLTNTSFHLNEIRFDEMLLDDVFLMSLINELLKMINNNYDISFYNDFLQNLQDIQN